MQPTGFMIVRACLARRLPGLSAGNKNVKAGSHLVLSGSALDLYQNRMRMASPFFIFVAAAKEVEAGLCQEGFGHGATAPVLKRLR